MRPHPRATLRQKPSDMPNNRLNVLVHLVWSTWKRDPQIVEAWEPDLHRYIEAVCRNVGYQPAAVGGTADHVHLLVSLSNTVTLATLMQAVKGGASHFVNDSCPVDCAFRWQGGYGAFGVSPRDRARVIAYIRNQKAHHANGTLWPHAEMVCDERCGA